MHVVGNYAILPDAGDNPIDVGPFLKSGGQGGYDWSKVESFCAQSQTRCISIRRAHPQNQHVGAILLAARNVILDGANSTDGLSLAVFAETYSSGASASLDLSPATATAPPPAARHQDDDELWQV